MERNILNENEEKLIKRVYIANKISFFLLGLPIILLLVFVFYTMILGAFFNDYSNLIFKVTIFFIVLYVFIFLFTLVYYNMGIYGKKWDNIIDKVNNYYKGNEKEDEDKSKEEYSKAEQDQYDTDLLYRYYTSGYDKNIKEEVSGRERAKNDDFLALKLSRADNLNKHFDILSNATGIDLPNFRRIRSILFLIPFLIMTIIFIINIVQFFKIRDETLENVSGNIKEIISTLSDDYPEYNEYIFDENGELDQYKYYGYYLQLYTYEDGPQVSLNILNNGKINKIEYEVPYDYDLTLEENLDYSQKEITKMNYSLRKIRDYLLYEEMLDYYEYTELFTVQYLDSNPDNLESIDVFDSERIEENNFYISLYNAYRSYDNGLEDNVFAIGVNSEEKS